MQLLRSAKRTFSPQVGVTVASSSNMAELYGTLQRLNRLKSTEQSGLTLMGLGDYWLVQAIQSELIEPLKLPEATLNQLASQWLSLVQRNDQGDPSETGQLWGAPYRWGSTVLIYRKDKLDALPGAVEDWDMLWNPALSQRVGLLNQPREVIGMVLKTLGQSYNDGNPMARSQLREKLRSLHQQTRLYSSKNYIEPLILGDIWVAMGWSSDVIPALSQDKNLGVIFPKSGSALWADLWVKAKGGVNDQADFPVDKFITQWVKYWWSPDVASDILKFTHAAPVISTPSAEPEKNALWTPSNFEVSEFLLPLGKDAIDQYQSLWLEMRQA